MKYPMMALAMAAALPVAACDEPKPVEAPKVEKKVEDTSYLSPACDKASMQVIWTNKAISYKQTDGKLTLRTGPTLDHTPKLDTAGEKPKYSGPAYDAWLKRRDADNAIIKGDYATQANYVLGKFEKQCPAVNLTKLREFIKIPAPAATPKPAA